VKNDGFSADPHIEKQILEGTSLNIIKGCCSKHRAATILSENHGWPRWLPLGIHHFKMKSGLVQGKIHWKGPIFHWKINERFPDPNKPIHSKMKSSILIQH